MSIRGALVTAMAATLLLAPAPASAQDRGAGGQAVIGWIEETLDHGAREKINPPQISRMLAIVSSSMDVALRDGRRRGMPPRPLIDSAARTALGTLGHERYADDPKPRRATPASLAAKRANRILERHSGDELDATVELPGAYPRDSGPDALWIPTPPAYEEPLEPAAGRWQTWNIRRVRHHLPDGPPSPDPEAPSHGRFLKEVAEVRDAADALTADQRLIADAWAGELGTPTPPGYWNQIAIAAIDGERQLFPPTAGLGLDTPANPRPERLGTRRTARLFALLNTAQADAFIVAWKAKYRWWLVRPVTWIREHLDPEWTPYVHTPPFPSYVSGHSADSGAASLVLAKLLPRRRDEFLALGREAMVSRLYGGIHFHADNIDGLRTGRSVARATLRAARRR